MWSHELTKNALEIIQDVNIAKAIHWLQLAWRDVSTETIINCFQKCGFGQESVNSITNDDEIDEEFESLFTQLRRDDKIAVEDFNRLATTSLRGSYLRGCTRWLQC